MNEYRGEMGPHKPRFQLQYSEGRWLCFQKRCKVSNTPIDNIKQVSSLKILGITFQNNSRFNEHTRNKMLEANRCLYLLRSVRKEGYSQTDIDHLFTTIVLPKISYGLNVYAAFSPELTTVQNSLRRCYKRSYVSYPIDIYDLVEKSDYAIFDKARNSVRHPLHELLPKVKTCCLRSIRSGSNVL